MLSRIAAEGLFVAPRHHRLDNASGDKCRDARFPQSKQPADRYLPTPGGGCYRLPAAAAIAWIGSRSAAKEERT
jgi:hypothetical protein